MKVGIIFGGNSTEHEVSVISAKNIINKLNKEKYDIYMIYMNKENEFFEVIDVLNITTLGDTPLNIKKIDNIGIYLKKLDLVIPVLHGKYGEDGSIQGFLEVLNIPYVGCKVLSSSICMNKMYTKRILKGYVDLAKDIGLKQIDNKIIYYQDCIPQKEVNLEEIDKLIKDNISYPVFIKPATLGSSVGISKVNNTSELNIAINEAFKYDTEILVEECIRGRELECAILDGKATSVGEVLSAEEFYNYSAKYQNEESKTIIPAPIEDDIESSIKRKAEDIFRIVDGKDLARIDFFLENNTNRIILNEINTFPGFTEISMYPKLIENASITYEELLDTLITNNVN